MTSVTVLDSSHSSDYAVSLRKIWSLFRRFQRREVAAPNRGHRDDLQQTPSGLVRRHPHERWPCRVNLAFIRY